MPKARRIPWQPLIAIAIIALILGLYIYSERYPISVFNQIERRTVDARFIARGPIHPTGKVAIIAIDQSSLDSLGRWPWPRVLQAKLIREILNFNPLALGLDISYPLPESWNCQEPACSGDQILSKTIQGQPVTPGYFFLSSKEESSKQSKETQAKGTSVLTNLKYPYIVGFDKGRDYVKEIFGIESNMRLISEAATLQGFFNVLPDADGVVRRCPLALRLGQDIFPSLEISMLAIGWKINRADLGIKLANWGVDKIALKNHIITPDETGSLALNYRGPARTIPTYRAIDLLEGKVTGQFLTDHFILLGVTAPGVFDQSVTPFGKQGYPGVEVHATCLDNILGKDALESPQVAKILDMIAIIFWPLLILLILRKARVGVALAAFLISLAAHYTIVQLSFNYAKMMISATFPVASLLLTFLFLTVHRWFSTGKLAAKLVYAFTYYVPSSVVRRLATDPDSVALGGEKRNISILFMDLTGFSTIAAQLSPEKSVDILSQFLEEATGSIIEMGGTLDKYLGDGLMALFGAPLDLQDHQIRACGAAISIFKRINLLNEKLSSKNIPALTCRIGINSGEVIVGNIGSSKRFDYTAIGHNVNVAQRLEQLNKTLQTCILVSQSVYQAASSTFRFIDHGSSTLIKGTESQQIYELTVDN